MEERRFFGTDVHEGGLNAGQHCFDLAKVHVADHAARVWPVDEQLDQLTVLDDGDARLARRRVHQELSLH